MKNKKKIILVASILLLVIIATILTIVFLSNKNKKQLTESEKNIYEGLVFVNNMSLLGDYQKRLEENYINQFKAENYNLENPLVINNPYEIAPLSSLIMFKTDDAVSGKITIKGKENYKDLVFEFDKNTEHYITIWGLYENYKNQIVIELSTGQTKEIEIDLTSEEVSELKYAEIIENKNNIDEFFLLDTPIGTSLKMIDSNGNLRVKFENGISKYVKQLENGNILVSDGNFDLSGKSNGLIEIDLSGKVYNYYKLDYGMYYGSVVLENGNILYMTQEDKELQSFDKIVEIDSKGKLVRTISIFELMKKIDSDYMETIKDKWGYISGIDYDKENNELLVSLWYSSAVIGIDYKKGEINWILSNPANLSEKFTKYLITPTDQNFEYPKGAYAIDVTNEGFSLMVTNWDLNDSLLCSSIIDRKSYVTNYKLNRSNKTINETKSFGKNANYFSYALGDYNHYQEYDLVLFGRELQNPDYNNPSCLLNNYWYLYSKLLLINNNGEIIFDATINSPEVIADIYKVNKKINNKFVDAKTFNFEFKGNSEEIVSYKDYKDLIENSTIYNYGMGFEENKLTINATENEKLLLVSSDNKIYKYEYKSIDEINYYLLNSHNEYFRVFIEKDGKVYNTGAYLYI